MKFAIIFGGNSYEHEISIVSAITLKDKIKNHEISFIYIDQHRDIYLINAENMKSKYFASGEYKKAQRIEFAKNGFKYTKGMLKKEIHLEFDAVINLIHGKDGEDGKLPAIFEFYNIKAVTPSVEASVLSYNKVLTKSYAKQNGVDVIDYEIIEKPSTKFDFPVIIKPARLGSSIGVSVAKTQEELEYAFDVAKEFDSLIIAEPFIEGIEEYNLAGCFAEGEYIFSKIEKVEKSDFLDFEKKYMDFSRKNVMLSEIDDETAVALKEAFIKIYNTEFKNALIRCDFFIKDKKVYLNEINPIPGSMANYLFEDFEDVLAKLASSLQSEKHVSVNFEYINKIQMAKGK